MPAFTVTHLIEKLRHLLRQKKKKEKNPRKTAEEPEGKSRNCLEDAALPCPSSGRQELIPGSRLTQVTQPEPQPGVWERSGNPPALQKGLRDLFGGRNSQVCQTVSAWKWIKPG